VRHPTTAISSELAGATRHCMEQGAIEWLSQWDGNLVKLLADEGEVWEIMVRSKTSDQDTSPIKIATYQRSTEV